MINVGVARKFAYAYSELMYIVVTFSYGFLGWVMGLDEDVPWSKTSPILWRACEYIQHNSLYIYGGLAILAVAAFVAKRMGDPWIVNKLKSILNGYQKGAFKGDDPFLKDRDRVTIFKYKKRSLFTRHWSSSSFFKPWGKNPVFASYLIPFMRSGHISQRSKASFYTSDDPDKAEGVAGKAWACNRPIVLNDLPNLTLKSLARDKASYAQLTFTEVAMVDKCLNEGKKLPRSIAAIPIESNGVVWGVVVLDSGNPLGVTTDSVTNYSLTVALIGELLERM
ncbi:MULTISPECIES: GAF domain-containing protein [Pseudomonas]|uniref:GAF domain-containing protein n=1 Tax=Pseudomonas TaxID=286 RepID=UPI0018AB35F8|nr:MULTISPECIES: GAF domain-containing protein [Pseudomonas]MBF8774453.1 GAF domain-containing protein [Pseudomonas fulva]MBR7520350.1 GAF domain-containing protein [Pseudomonas juntendi]